MNQFRKNSAGILFLLSILYMFFPSLAKRGLFENATNVEIGISALILVATAIILYLMPDEKKN